MAVPKIDADFAARQILAVFAKYKITVAGVLRRHQFFEARDSDFQRGIDAAVAKGWIQRHERDRYRYILTANGREAFDTVLVPADRRGFAGGWRMFFGRSSRPRVVAVTSISQDDAVAACRS